MNKILEQILTDTYTLRTLKHRVRVLRQYIEQKLYSPSTQYELAPEDLQWLKGLPEQFFKQFNQKDFTAIFEGLEAEISKINPLTIYLAFEPGKEEINSIHSWLRQSLATKVVIETKLDPSLIGGCAMVWNGVYKDYSLKARIQAQRTQILEEFKKSWR